MIFWLVVISFSVVGAQGDFEKISQDTQLLLQAYEIEDYGFFVDQSYPTIFKVVDRESVLKEITEAFTGDDDVSIEIVDLEAMKFDISEIYTSDIDTLRSYAFLKYPLKLKMTQMQVVMDETFREILVSLLPDNFVVTFEGEHIVYIQMRSLMVAIKDELTNQSWKYLTFDETNFLNDIIYPQDIYPKILEYYNEVFLKE
jgi:hypothetical protein